MGRDGGWGGWGQRVVFYQVAYSLKSRAEKCIFQLISEEGGEEVGASDFLFAR